MPVDGGEAKVLTDVKNDVKSFKWSPDGTMIAFVVEDPPSEQEKQDVSMGRDWTVVEQNLKPLRLWAIETASGASRIVTTNSISVWDYDWSPDGKNLAIAATEKNLTDDSYMYVQLMRVSANGGVPALVCKTEGKLGSPRWSNDGKWIAFRGAVAMNDPYAGNIFIVLASGGTPQNVTKGYKGTVTWIQWLRGSSVVTFCAIEGAKNVLKSISVPTGIITSFIDNDLVFNGASYGSDGKRLALAANTARHPDEVWYGETNTKSVKRMTNFNPQLGSVALGEQEVVKWKHADGTEIEGVLVKSVGYKQGQRYPTVLQIHGGPEGAYVNGWNAGYSNWAQLLAANGYAVLMPNYRGSIGRGTEYSMADHRDLMGKEFEDMVAGVDYLIREGLADPERLGIGGGSYGGYSAAWAATASTRFKASVVFAGITNWYSMTGTSDIFWENSLVHWDKIMYENFDVYWQRSPVAHINKANTPTLILHGASDLRVPTGQGQELYRALLWKGVPVECVIYPREGHGLVEREHQVDSMKRVLSWFNRYLKPSLSSH